eukprot:gnl/Hemi2/16020_TR5304_c0_g1_i1.p1 gnl/Hemi2/16020_TR5304_c0_g1~~gnl/Hemi2/16020_TR5304_c0_g1_i1.p1  ORF type:complete len:185 (+),score=40.06 gnl/Hemi2/16020_TR5304_c0_g1_i1:33-587(+)
MPKTPRQRVNQLHAPPQRVRLAQDAEIKKVTARDNEVREAVASKLVTQPGESLDAQEKAVLSRGQRKRNDRKEHFLKRMRPDDILLANQSKNIRKKAKEQQKQAEVMNFDFSDLLTEIRQKEESDAVKKPQQQPRERTRLKANLKEINLFNKVVSHPVFQADCLGTLKQHLMNTLPPAPGATKP